MKTSRGTDESLRCSFCHKSQDAVAKLISSPSDYPRAYICDECVAVCNSILEDDRTEAQPGAAPAHLPKPDLQGGAAGGYAGYLDRIGPLITADDWKATATFLNEKAAALQKVGLRLSYHNHNVEFRPVGATDGLEILLKETDPRRVHFEMDVGWVAAGGADPIKLLEQHKGRFRMMHVKDLMATTKTNYAMRQDPAEVGNGMLPWRKILDVAYSTGVRKFFVEQEPPFKGDPLDSIAISARYLSTIA